MRSLKAALFAGATFAAALAPAQAVDLGPIMQPRPIAPVQVEEMTRGWYLRGDIGVGAQSFNEFGFTQTNPAFVWPASWRIDRKEFGDAVFGGGGVGFQWNSWLRVDGTAEYRAKSKFKTIGSYTGLCPGGRCFEAYDGKHSAIAVMANAYIDLGTWMYLTPFVGAGAGYARHTISGLRDVGLISDGSAGFAGAQGDHSEWKFAWAVHAGVAYNIDDSFKMEVAYRYLNFGNVNTGIVDCAAGCATGGGPRAFYTFRDLDSHDLKFGMRWMLAPEPQAPAAPMLLPPPMRKG